MLRIIQNQAAASAKSYYSQADYLSEGQELVGDWGGRTAELLGLWGTVDKRQFDRLCDNLHPATGRQLTPRTRFDRSVGYDCNFHAPKGVSVALSLLGDERIAAAFEQSVAETMEDMECDARTRIRRRGMCDDRVTANLVWAGFTHLTARPVDGIPDMHLHKHCFTLNVTYDDTEKVFKACQFRDIKRDAPYFEALFHSRLAKRIVDLGYTVERKGRSWDIVEVPQSVRDKFSRRTGQIEELAAEEGILDAAEKDKLAAKSREAKVGGLAMSELRKLWWERLSEDERDSLNRAGHPVRRPLAPTSPQEAAVEALDQARLHCFERASVVPERQLLAEAIRRGVGRTTANDISSAHAQSDAIVRNYRNRKVVTTPNVLAEERAVFDFAREMKGLAEPLNEFWSIHRDWLNHEQRAAVQHVLTSRDGVIVLSGGAGTGKTSLMQEAVSAIEAGGHQVFAFAPSAEASRGVLAAEGFAGATTVAELLINDKLQESARGQVIWIDEAGLLGMKTQRQVFDIADRLGARVVLSGDWRQHASVERGSPLKLLERYADLTPAFVREIQRQKGAYRDAVAAIAAGDLASGFKQLDKLGWIKEISGEDRNAVIAKEYADSTQNGMTTLLVSPTRAEGDQISEAIRRELKSRNRIGAEDREIVQLQPLHLTEAERRDAAFYRPGDVIVFQRSANGHRKGERITVGDSVSSELAELADAFGIFRESGLAIARGDLIRMTANGTTLDGKHRLNNGSVHRVKGVDARGNIKLQNGWTIARDYGYLSHGYVLTSHASQGKTVDHVILAESSMSFPAGSQEQFYVSASRGRRKCTVFTDDRESLKESISGTSVRLSATELLENDRKRRRRASTLRQLANADTNQPIATYGR
ncbi:MAG: MobF family relaxase [Pirellulaceae bacterium]